MRIIQMIKSHKWLSMQLIAGFSEIVLKAVSIEINGTKSKHVYISGHIYIPFSHILVFFSKYKLIASMAFCHSYGVWVSKGVSECLGMPLKGPGLCLCTVVRNKVVSKNVKRKIIIRSIQIHLLRAKASQNVHIHSDTSGVITMPFYWDFVYSNRCSRSC